MDYLDLLSLVIYVTVIFTGLGVVTENEQTTCSVKEMTARYTSNCRSRLFIQQFQYTRIPNRLRDKLVAGHNTTRKRSKGQKRYNWWQRWDTTYRIQLVSARAI